MNTPDQPAASSVLQLDEARTLHLLGAQVRFLATSETTDDEFAVLDYLAPAHFPGPPLHWHAHTTEAFYVLEGTVTFIVDGHDNQAGPGAFALVRPGTIHTFANRTDAPARFLSLISPGGFERYFDELADLVAREGNWPPSDPAKLEALVARHDTHDASQAVAAGSRRAP